MKKTLYFLLTSILLLTGCSSKTDFTIKGKISGLESDTLMVYYSVPAYKVDTIFCKDGAFEYSFVPDTLTMFSLLLNAQESIPVFANKGQTVELTGSVDDFTIKGEGENKLMNEIFIVLRNTPKRDLMEKVDSLILKNYESFTNIYLIDKYYAKAENPDFDHIKELIERQSGIIKDTPYIMDLETQLNAFTNKNRNRTISVLEGKDRDGEFIKWSTVRDHYILIDFWASWHPESTAEQDSLVRVLKELKKEKFQIYSVSLDLSKEDWLKASDRDTTQWHQVCDFKGWNNSLIKAQNIHTLPANLLLDKNKRIIERNIRGQELIDKVKQLIEEDKKREKEKKLREKNAKRKKGK